MMCTEFSEIAQDTLLVFWWFLFRFLIYWGSETARDSTL